MDTSGVADVSQVYAVSIFRVKVSGVTQCSCFGPTDPRWTGWKLMPGHNFFPENVGTIYLRNVGQHCVHSDMQILR
jgi:hypothetical protein